MKHVHIQEAKHLVKPRKGARRARGGEEGDEKRNVLSTQFACVRKHQLF